MVNLRQTPIPKNFPLLIVCKNKYIVVFGRIDKIHKDEEVQLSTMRNLEDHGELILPGPKKSGQTFGNISETSYFSQIQVGSSV